MEPVKRSFRLVNRRCRCAPGDSSILLNYSRLHLTSASLLPARETSRTRKAIPVWRRRLALRPRIQTSPDEQQNERTHNGHDETRGMERRTRLRLGKEPSDESADD